MSERDGWSHLYLYDGVTGRVKNQITKGAWAVHNVDRVDEANRQIWFTANGMNADQDPYFFHSYRINFDGTGLVAYTSANAQHAVSWSPDHAYYVDTYSRVDTPPVSELHRTSDRALVTTLERGDMTDLLATGWRAPEVFTAKGRDNTTDIWGIIVRPTNFDPARKYPVIETIYAGPHGSFVPKTFNSETGAAWLVSTMDMQSLSELGFIVVQIDGMGTANRSKAFHNVAWKNLADGGFEDRIRWHKAVAAKYPYYDITRVGIYGTSAGGQESLAALLFHPEFYKAAASSAGCHDNRMDKIWWNEQWMGWPIGPQYAASSNTEHARSLKGDLMLLVGELDTNVDPCVDAAGGESAGEGEQGFRARRDSRRRSHQRRRVRRSQAFRFLRAPPAGAPAAGVESAARIGVERRGRRARCARGGVGAGGGLGAVKRTSMEERSRYDGPKTRPTSQRPPDRPPPDPETTQ